MGSKLKVIWKVKNTGEKESIFRLARILLSIGRTLMLPLRKEVSSDSIRKKG